MKKNLTYLLPVCLCLLLLATACSPNKATEPVPTPTGTFNGQFRVLHRAKGATKIDTLKANLQLVLENGGTFKVLGDTSTIHAGSKGSYTVSGSQLAFLDNTYSTTSTAKIHLYGYYNYFYDGTSVFQMVLNSADTLSLQYDLKKTN